MEIVHVKSIMVIAVCAVCNKLVFDKPATDLLFIDAVVSCGALGNLSEAMTLMSDVPKLVKVKNNQLEEFCSYRVRLRTGRMPWIHESTGGNVDELDYRITEYFEVLASEGAVHWELIVG